MGHAARVEKVNGGAGERCGHGHAGMRSEVVCGVVYQVVNCRRRASTLLFRSVGTTALSTYLGGSHSTAVCIVNGNGTHSAGKRTQACR